MKVGMLWYDGDRKKAVADKIEEGLRRYEDKFGYRPNACHVNPSLSATYPSLRIVPNRLIQPDHFWLGDEGDD